MSKKQSAEQTAAIEKLQAMLPPGTRVYTVLRNVTRSGMTRHISCVVASKPAGEQDCGRHTSKSVCRECSALIEDITWLVGCALGYKRHHKDGGLIVGGGGMDMGDHVVMNLSYVIHGMKDREEHKAGYSLIQEWL